MSSAVIQETSPARALLPKLGSLLAVAPLSVWTAWHLWENLSAWQGATVWESRVTEPGNPVASALTSLIVFGPLFVHILWGARRLKMTRANAYPFFGNLKYVLQRLSALGLLAFIAAHVYLARIAPALRNPNGHEDFGDLAAHMRHHPPTLIVYILGVLGTAYHLANGVYTASFVHGLAASPKASRRMQVISVLLLVALLGFGWGAVAGLYTAGADFPAPID